MLLLCSSVCVLPTGASNQQFLAGEQLVHGGECYLLLFSFYLCALLCAHRDTVTWRGALEARRAPCEHLAGVCSPSPSIPAGMGLLYLETASGFSSTYSAAVLMRIPVSATAEPVGRGTLGRRRGGSE